jgi:hypothetical protein
MSPGLLEYAHKTYKESLKHRVRFATIASQTSFLPTVTQKSGSDQGNKTER